MLSAGIAGFLLIISLLTFWRAHGLEARELGVLTGGVDALTAGWQAKGVPEAERVVNIIISDAEPEMGPFVTPADPGLLDRAIAWFRRSIWGGKPQAQTPTAFARAVADETSAVVWTHEGFSTVSEEAMSREVMKAVVKAHDMGAEINIVTQGVSVGPVLAGLKRLEGVERGGVKVGVNKVLIVGIDPPRLKRIPSIASYDFTRLGNVIELANIWSPDGSGGARLRVYGAKMKGEEYEVANLWPVLNAPGVGLERLLDIIKELVTRVEALEKAVGRLADAATATARVKAAADAAQAEAAKQAVMVKSHEGSYRPKEASGDSLSMITGGKGYSEGAKKASASAIMPEQSNSSGELSERKFAKCCADVGGTWRHADDGYYALPRGEGGCCQGARFNSKVESCDNARIKNGQGYAITDARFRCAPQ